MGDNPEITIEHLRDWMSAWAKAQDEADEMRPVYDAAMAWSKACNDYYDGPTSLLGVGLELAEGRLLDACRRAKEER